MVPGDVLSLADVEAEIQRLVGAMEAATDEFAELGTKAGEAEVAYKRAHAFAYLAADGPVVSREAQADLGAADELLARRYAEVAFDACKERLRTIRTALDACRTIAANARGQS
jgi:hypothetical protein